MTICSLGNGVGVRLRALYSTHGNRTRYAWHRAGLRLRQVPAKMHPNLAGDTQPVLEFVLKGAALGFSAAAMPGLFQTYMISQAAQHGWRRAGWVSLAPLLSDGPAVLVVILLLSRLPAWSMNALQIIGGGFMLYLTLGAWRTLRQLRENPASPSAQGATGVTVLKAATLNLLNPMVYIYWATVSGPLFIQGWSQRPTLGMGLIIAFYGVMVTVSLGIIVLVSTLKGVHAQATRVMLALSLVLMVGMGLAQIWSGVAALRA